MSLAAGLGIVAQARSLRKVSKVVCRSFDSAVTAPIKNGFEIYRSKYILTGEMGPVFTHGFFALCSVGYFACWHAHLKYHDPRYIAHKAAERGETPHAH